MVCRLCLKAIPSESVIKLYQDLNCATEALEMVKHIEKYLDIEVRQDDVVSTMICQDCHDHLEEFHKFYQDVKGKQCTLHNNFLEVELKEESHDSRDVDVKNNDDSNKVDGNDKISNVAKEIEQAMFESPIDIMKTEADDEKDEQEVIATDVLDDDVDLDKEDVFADDGVDIDSADLQSSEDDVPLINLKTKKKITLKRKYTTKGTPKEPKERKQRREPRERKEPKEPKERKERKVPKERKEPKEPRKKGERKKNLSAQELIATSMELKCDICQVQVNTWKELRQHFLLAHTRTPYIKCCDTVYEKQRPLADHLQWHKNPDAFKCKMCNEVLSNSRDLTSHISSQHPDNVDILENYECEHCFKQFRNYTIFKNHLRTHSKDKDVECQICNKRLESEFQLRRHMDSFHKDASLHICDICGKHFKCKDSFKRHYQVHQGIVEPAVQCSICKSWLKNQHSLRIHRFVHEEHPNSCNVCGKQFKTRHTLRRHMKYWHELERNLHCTYCDKVFRQKRNLEEHMATHTGAQLYTCPHCGKESRSKSNMYVHIKRVHPNEWWQSKVERLNLDPSTEHPEVEKYRQQQQDVLKLYDTFLNK
ncbi:transcription factor grauzone isoform X2 [Stomoxys calcitrans]|uniref:Transcription factor grauzone n=1 Tax=Stomoxys calcitrans TaxID=35570 RepID=A0A1I8PTF9_STOCA|nr:transcription factor grauzone isoform X2 [Stomoxys calcitrans]